MRTVFPTARGSARLLALASALATLACGSGAPSATSTTGAPRPSVILVSIDTLRADHVALYGYPRDTTPFLDRWAKDATVFEHAFSPAAWTLVAHMTMLTGLFPAQHGVVKEDLALDPGIPLLAERLKAAGYQTVGLYHPCWVHARHGFDRGFDVFRGHEDAEEAGQHLTEELARLDRGRPFFLFLHLFDVHNGPARSGANPVYPAPPPYRDQFMTNAADKLPKLPPEELWESTGLLDAQQVEALVALYDGGVRYVDAKLEQFFGVLEQGGFLANTLVIVTADHGEALAQRGRLAGHGEFAQEGLHVPLIVRHPQGLLAGRRVSEVVHLGDLVPTVLALAGLAADPRLPGRSLFEPLPAERVITGSLPPREYVVRWPHKIIQWNGGPCVGFDLDKDPGELAQEPVRARDFLALKAQAFARTDFPAARSIGPLPEADRAELRALGYGGEDGR